MIHFIEDKNIPKSKKKIIIDLTHCNNQRECILLISRKITGKDSPLLQTGNSLDAFFDVLSDYFIENWGEWKDIYIYGWCIFSTSNPILSQKILSLMMESYIVSVSGEIQMIIWNKTTLDNSNILEFLKDKKPNIYLIMS